MNELVNIQTASGEVIQGDLAIPAEASALVIFAHGSGSSRRSPRNRFVAKTLNEAGLATLLLDLLTESEEAVDLQTREHRFNIDLLAKRLEESAAWAESDPRLAGLPVCYFGSSTGGGAALVAAAARPDRIDAVVSRGGRPDLAGEALARVRAPTLLVVGGNDVFVIDLNRQAATQMRCQVDLKIIPGATHLFEEPGKLEQVADAAAEWFVRTARR
jgi:putative phosphoribosyl transferase